MLATLLQLPALGFSAHVLARVLRTLARRRQLPRKVWPVGVLLTAAAVVTAGLAVTQLFVLHATLSAGAFDMLANTAAGFAVAAQFSLVALLPALWICQLSVLDACDTCSKRLDWLEAAPAYALSALPLVIYVSFAVAGYAATGAQFTLAFFYATAKPVLLQTGDTMAEVAALNDPGHGHGAAVMVAMRRFRWLYVAQLALLLLSSWAAYSPEVPAGACLGVLGAFLAALCAGAGAAAEYLSAAERSVQAALNGHDVPTLLSVHRKRLDPIHEEEYLSDNDAAAAADDDDDYVVEGGRAVGVSEVLHVERHRLV